MGVLELIKLGRIQITTVRVVEDVIEYEERGLEMMFKLNEDYVPTEGEESEFDAPPVTEEESEEKTDE